MSGFSVSFDVLSWSAWAPGLVSPEASEEKPELKFVPAMQRRRLSRLSKMTLQALHDCLVLYAEKTNTDKLFSCASVFASPHGEIHRTVKLLQDLAQEELLSPMGFSLSVHNTAAGLYSIVAGEKSASTSVASGCDTFEQAMIEAVTQSHQSGEPVALVYTDEPLPEAYATEFPAPFPFSLSLLVCHNPEGQWCLRSGLSPSFPPSNKNTNTNTSNAQVNGLALIPLLEEELLEREVDLEVEFEAAGERSSWLWTKKPL